MNTWLRVEGTVYHSLFTFKCTVEIILKWAADEQQVAQNQSLTPISPWLALWSTFFRAFVYIRFQGMLQRIKKCPVTDMTTRMNDPFCQGWHVLDGSYAGSATRCLVGDSKKGPLKAQVVWAQGFWKGTAQDSTPGLPKLSIACPLLFACLVHFYRGKTKSKPFVLGASSWEKETYQAIESSLSRTQISFVSTAQTESPDSFPSLALEVP